MVGGGTGGDGEGTIGRDDRANEESLTILDNLWLICSYSSWIFLTMSVNVPIFSFSLAIFWSISSLDDSINF
jgi:hypothetical protein